LADWLIGCLANQLVIGWLIGGLVGWLLGQLGKPTNRPTDQPANQRAATWGRLLQSHLRCGNLGPLVAVTFTTRVRTDIGANIHHDLAPIRSHKQTRAADHDLDHNKAVIVSCGATAF